VTTRSIAEHERTNAMDVRRCCLRQNHARLIPPCRKG